jgi:hypothetical protein
LHPVHRDLPAGRLALLRYRESAEAAAARCSAAWGVEVAVYRVQAGGPGAVFVGEKQEGKGE